MNFPSVNPQFKRIAIILLAGLGVVTLVLLAASLTNVELKPARQFFTAPDQEEPIFDFSGITESVESLSIGEAIMLIGGFLVLFGLLLAMLSPEARKRLIKTVLRVGLTAWAIYYALTKFRPEGVFGTEPEVAELQQQAPPIVVTPPPYTPPAIPSWVTYVVSLLVVLFFAGIGVWLYRLFRPPKSQLKNLARAARTALNDISSGRDWNDTVIQCYARMGAALDAQRGLSRQQDMTPQEFAQRLEQAGLPSDPVRRLTRLFEKARYSGRSSSNEDVNEAVTCLSSILHAIGEKP